MLPGNPPWEGPGERRASIASEEIQLLGSKTAIFELSCELLPAISNLFLSSSSLSLFCFTRRKRVPFFRYTLQKKAYTIPPLPPCSWWDRTGMIPPPQEIFACILVLVSEEAGDHHNGAVRRGQGAAATLAHPSLSLSLYINFCFRRRGVNGGCQELSDGYLNFPSILTETRGAWQNEKRL